MSENIGETRKLEWKEILNLKKTDSGLYCTIAVNQKNLKK